MGRYHVGGSFAPPLIDERIERYEALATTAEPAVRGALTALITCCRRWSEVPRSNDAPITTHQSGRGKVVQLTGPAAIAMAGCIPAAEEIEGYQRQFDELSTTSQQDLRNAAFHLLWFVKELELGREPITTDKL